MTHLLSAFGCKDWKVLIVDKISMNSRRNFLIQFSATTLSGLVLPSQRLARLERDRAPKAEGTLRHSYRYLAALRLK